MKAAIYSRKSKFTGKGESIGNQVEMCRDYIATNYNGEEHSIQVFEDEGFSGKNLDRPQFKKMIEIALSQLAYSYTPYSDFKVGAALLGKNGRIYTGCNIENAAYTPTNCAERTAFFKAVSEGVKEFDAICIVGGKGGVVTEYAPPCGVCRQVMMEFCDPETFQIILAIDAKHYDIYTLKEMLPKGFGPSNLTE